MIESPFLFDKKKAIKLSQLEKRLMNLIQMKYDVLGITEDSSVREKLHNIEMSILFSQYLIRDIYFQDIHNQMNSIFDETIKEEIMKMSEENGDEI